MAATFYWTLRYGGTGSTKVVGFTHTATGTETKESGMGPGGSLDRIDFLSIDSGESVNGAGTTRINYFDYPIRAGQNSMERWVRAKWDFEAGVTNKITGVYFWMSSGSNNSGATVRVHGIVTGGYIQPTTGTTAIGIDYATWNNATGNVVNLVPTGSTASPPANAYIVTFSGSATVRELTASNYSNYIVLQLRTSSSASPGNVETKQFTIQYDES